MSGVEILGALAGVTGSGLLASNTRASAYGFHFYLVSNVCMISFGLEHAHWGIVAMNTVFLVTAIAGIWRWSWGAR